MNPDGMPPAEILDPSTLQQLLDLDDGGLGLIREMYELFRDDTPPRMAQLAEAIRQGNMEVLGDTAHAVKGAASTMGAPKVRAIAQVLEAGGRLGTFPQPASVLLAQLEQAFAEALGALETFIASRS